MTKYIESSSDYVTNVWTRALVQWLKDETHDQKVVISNPGAGYQMDFFTLICYKICIDCLKRPKINEKEVDDCPCFEKNNPIFKLIVNKFK